MKYTTSIEINRPIDQVVMLFDNVENYKHWMEGLNSFEIISGEPGKKGTKSKFKFEMGKREIEMVETVLKRDLPNEYIVSYNTKGVLNTVKNIFEKIDDTTTRHSTENEFHFSGFMKLIGFLMPAMFKKQSLKYQIDFKNFVESK